jgi:regulator of protease activity HflC (stomatin/prohibitin superfamily)
MRDAEARERLAEAEANATRMVAEAAAGAGVEALRYFISDKYVRAFERLAESPNQKLVLVPMESAGLAGGIVAALELLRGPPGAGPPAGAAAVARPAPAAPPPAGNPWTTG